MVNPLHEAAYLEYQSVREKIAAAWQAGDKKLFAQLIVQSQPVNAVALLWTMFNQVDILERSTGE